MPELQVTITYQPKRTWKDKREDAIKWLKKFLHGFGIYAYPISEIYPKFLEAKNEADETFADCLRLLQPRQVEAFIVHHEKYKKWYEQYVDDMNEDEARRLWFRLQQIDNLLSWDLEKAIRRAKGIGNVVRRED